jgi:uracil-DNA glycosylase
VRVVVLGQDPYPEIRSATGRAFEDGTRDAEGKRLRAALVRLAGSARELAAGTGVGPLCPRRDGRAAAIRAHFDHLRDQGVFFVNASWTFTQNNKVHQDAHWNMWKPVTGWLLGRLVAQINPPPIFLLLGKRAEKSFDEFGLNGVQTVRHAHPTSRAGLYFENGNTFEKVNNALLDLGQDPVEWWFSCPPSVPT